jgi:hypothetical protein
MNKKYAFLLSLAMFGLYYGARAQESAKAPATQNQTCGCDSANHPGYPKAKLDDIVYFSEQECYKANPDTCVSCFQNMMGVWYALAKFPTLSEKNPRTGEPGVYLSLEELLATNGLGAKKNARQNSRGIWCIEDPRAAKIAKSALENNTQR